LDAFPFEFKMEEEGSKIIHVESWTSFYFCFDYLITFAAQLFIN